MRDRTEVKCIIFTGHCVDALMSHGAVFVDIFSGSSGAVCFQKAIECFAESVLHS